MIPDEVLSQAPRILSQNQREHYFGRGYLLVERLISVDWLERLAAVTAGFVEQSREVSESGAVFDLAPGHSPDRSRLRRLKRPDERYPLYWEFATGPIADVAADLLGPDVVFHHAKLNFKWHEGGDAVTWHQDIQFYPHTNYGVLAIGVYLEDTGPDDGPVAVLPGSHEGPLYDQYDAGGAWTGGLSPADVAKLDFAKAVYLPGPRGSITVHNCRTVHGSPGSKRDGGRPLLLNAFSAGDAFPYTPHPDPSVHAGKVVRGRRARWARHDPRPCQIPPDWSGGYTSIFAAQAGEDG
jgi:ectoine hydroxylase-related dioxygenase (phytanoyl-CoA dioxygenase family)